MNPSEMPEEGPTIGPAIHPGPVDDLSLTWVTTPLDDPDATTASGVWFAGPPEDPDRYELIGAGLAGGEGQLWQARYRGSLTEPITLALKLLHRPINASASWPPPADRRRWQDQAALLRHLDLDRVVKVHEVFFGARPHLRGDGHSAESLEVAPYVVMEWVDGDTLATAVRGIPVTSHTLRTRLQYAHDVAQAIAALHSRSRRAGNPTLHRDIKPSNCIVHPERGVVLVDTSSMRMLDDGADPAGMHTPAYTSPEVRAEPLAPRLPSCDVYALGAVLAFCLLGEDPPALNHRDVRRRALGDALLDVGKAAHMRRPDEVADLILTAMHADPTRRPVDTVAWARQVFDAAGVPPADLDGAAADAIEVDRAHPKKARRRALGTTAAAIVLIGGAAVLRSMGGDNSTPLPSASTTAPSASRAGADLPPIASRPGLTGKITSPVTDAQVKRCSFMTGTSSLPQGLTLILAMRNLDNGDPHAYVELPYGWDSPSGLASWRGAQYFGTGDSSVGQRYTVDLVAVDLGALKKAIDINDAAINDLATSGTVLDRVELKRIAGAVPNNCRRT